MSSPFPSSREVSGASPAGRHLRSKSVNQPFSLRTVSVIALSSALVALYRDDIPGLLGIVYQFGSASVVSVIDGVQVAILMGIEEASSGTTQLTGVADSCVGTSPLFVTAGLESWNMAPSDAQTLVSPLGSQFEVVRRDVFFRLALQSMGKA